MNQDDYEHQALELAEQIATMSDKELVSVHQQTNGTLGDPYVEARIAAM